MNCCKLFVIASVLFFGGCFGQLRFQRHLNTTATPTQKGLDQGLAEVNASNLDGALELVSDYGDVVLNEPHVIVEVELLQNGQLELQVCADSSDSCLDKTVNVCYDAIPGKIKGRGGCGEFNQCGIQAGVRKEEGDVEYLWYMHTTTTSKKQVTGSQTCAQAIMKYPTAKISGFDVDSCDPLKHDGNVVKLYVKQVYQGCSIKVLNAKRWYSATTPSPTTPLPLSSTKSLSNETESSSSANADTTWWIVGGVLAGILVLVILGCIGCWVYRNHQQKKAAAAAKTKAEHELKYASLESLPTLDLATTTTAVQKEEKETPKKEDVVKKDKTEKKQKHKKVEVAPEPAKLMASKEAPPSVPASKVLPSKEATTEELKVKPSKEKVVVEVQKEKKAAKMSMNAMKVAQKEVAAAVPPPPPRRKAATPKQVTVEKTQEESPTIGKQDALEDGSSSPSIEKKPPKKSSKKKHAPPPTPPRGRRRSSKKIASRQLDSWERERPRGFSSREWMKIKAEKMRPPYIEYNPTGRRY